MDYYDKTSHYRDRLYQRNNQMEAKELDKRASWYVSQHLGVSGATGKYLNNLVKDGQRSAFENVHSYIKADKLREAGRYTPQQGLTSGVGFGLAGSFKAGRMDDIASLVFDTPRVAVESSMNALGLLTKQQKLAAASGGVGSKLMAAAIPFTAAAMVGSGMVDGDDPYTLLQNQMITVGGFTGAVAGLRVGGVMTPSLKQGVVRGLGRVAGGVAGGITGAGLAYGLSEGVRDMTSAESAIGKQAYQMASREYFGDITQTQATLTARQRALQQVNSSVFNDRGFTLGNEASILKNVGL